MVLAVPTEPVLMELAVLNVISSSKRRILLPRQKQNISTLKIVTSSSVIIVHLLVSRE